MSTVGDIMVKSVITIGPEETLQQVQKMMLKHIISRLVVVGKDGKPLGIVTQKDVVRFLLSDTSKRGIDEIPTEEVMSKALITVQPSASILNIAKTMLEKKISSIVVVDKSGVVAGIATKADICSYYADKHVGRYKVREFMTRKPITINPSQSIFLAASLMSEHNITRVIVVDKEKPVGILTLSDLTMISPILKPVRLMTERKPIFVKGLIMPSNYISLLTARDVMTADPISVHEDIDLAEAARLMTKHRFSGLPVVNIGEKLVGIVTKTDVTRAVASINSM
ncbi:CBS domain-containing protein [Candidatus Bathyarchaeota archaeon]|nr:CBS domain-containing protein [Candidatus Bathyarchaeota archaeon]